MHPHIVHAQSQNGVGSVMHPSPWRRTITARALGKGFRQFQGFTWRVRPSTASRPLFSFSVGRPPRLSRRREI